MKLGVNRKVTTCVCGGEIYLRNRLTKVCDACGAVER